MRKGLQTWQFWLPLAGATLVLSLLDFGLWGLLFSVINWIALAVLAMGARNLGEDAPGSGKAAVLLFLTAILSAAAYILNKVGYTGNEDPKLLIVFFILMLLPLLFSVGVYLTIAAVTGSDTFENVEYADRARAHARVLPFVAALACWAIMLVDANLPDNKELILALVVGGVGLVWMLTMLLASDLGTLETLAFGRKKRARKKEKKDG